MSVELINSIVVEYLSSILTVFTYSFNILNYEYICDFMSKKDTLYWWNIYNLIYYLFYKSMHTFLINLYFYIIQFFLIFIYNNMPNFLVKYLVPYIGYKQSKIYAWIKSIFTFLSIRYRPIKIILKKIYAHCFIVFKLYYIDYLRGLYYFLFFYIFYIMWKKRTTYRKVTFFKNGFKFYVLCLFFSYIFMYSFGNTFVSRLLALMLSFFSIWLTLN